MLLSGKSTKEVTRIVLRTVKDKALSAHDRLVRTAQKRSADQQGAFFTALFHLAAEAIKDDVKQFCDRAKATLEKVEAHGHEPQVDKDWLKEVTGEKDNFYFSTEKLMSDLVTTPRRKRRKKRLSDDEIKRIKNDIEAAIIDDDLPQDFHQDLTSSRAYVTKSSPMMRV